MLRSVAVEHNDSAHRLPKVEALASAKLKVPGRGLLFAGTEQGVYVTIDGGKSWAAFKQNMPWVKVTDLVIHPRDADMVIATHGRSLYIVDDIRPLEELTADVQAKDAYLFPPRPAFGFEPLPGYVESEGSAVYRGANPPAGAILTAYVKQYTGEPVKVSIANAAGIPVANLTLPGTPGLNRVTWDLKPTKDVLTEYGGEGAKFVRPGEYELTLTHGKTKQSQKLKIEIVCCEAELSKARDGFRLAKAALDRATTNLAMAQKRLIKALEIQ